MNIMNAQKKMISAFSRPKILRGPLFFLALVVWIGLSAGLCWAKPASTESPDIYYKQARKVYYSLIDSPSKRSSRDQWIYCVSKFQRVETTFPKSPQGMKAAFTIGKLYQEMFAQFHQADDLDRALGYYQKVSANFPLSSLADDAMFHQGEIHLDKKEYVLANRSFVSILLNYAEGDQAGQAQNKMRAIESEVRRQLARGYLPPEARAARVSIPATTGKASTVIASTPAKRTAAPQKAKGFNKLSLTTLQKVSYSSGPNKARVVVYTSAPAEISETSFSKSEGYRLAFQNSRLDKNLLPFVKIEDSILKGIRMEETNPGTSRLVLELNPSRDWKVVSSKNSAKVVLEIEARKPVVRLASIESAKPELVKNEKPVQTASRTPPVPVVPVPVKKGPPLIVIDPGHGGKDDGAKSHGLFEKEINLKVSRLLKKYLEKNFGYRVYLTRSDDTFIPVHDRGDIANEKGADLFVSVHANAAKRRSASGIETYYLGAGSSERAQETAARENGELVKSVQDDQVQAILANLLSTTKINDSSRLASRVQGRLYGELSKKYSGVKDLGVKEGPFYVLHDTNMPSILVELGFITNAREARRMKSSAYLDRLAQSIARGVHSFLKEKAPSI